MDRDAVLQDIQPEPRTRQPTATNIEVLISPFRTRFCVRQGAPERENVCCQPPFSPRVTAGGRCESYASASQWSMLSAPTSFHLAPLIRIYWEIGFRIRISRVFGVICVPRGITPGVGVIARARGAIVLDRAVIRDNADMKVTP